EGRPERGVAVGVGEGRPAVDFGTPARAAVAIQARPGMLFGQVVEDRRVLGQRPAVVEFQGRDRAGRVDPQVFGRFQPVAWYRDRLVGLADPLQHDVVRERTGARHVVQLHFGLRSAAAWFQRLYPEERVFADRGHLVGGPPAGGGQRQRGEVARARHDFLAFA